MKTNSKVSRRYSRAFPDGSVVKNPPANAGDTQDLVSNPGWEDPLKEEMQHTCLGKPVDRRACWATVCGVAKSQTLLREWACTHAQMVFKLQHKKKQGYKTVSGGMAETGCMAPKTLDEKENETLREWLIQQRVRKRKNLTWQIMEKSKHKIARISQNVPVITEGE